MKTTYYLVPAAAVAVAAMTVYAQLPDLSRPALPAAVSSAPAVPRLALPPVALPPDEPVAAPAPPVKPAEPTDFFPIPTIEPAKPLVPPVAAVPPPLPAVPVPPALPQVPKTSDAAPLVPLLPLPTPPAVQPVPLPLPVPKPAESLVPPPVPLPVPAPVLQPPVQPAPTPPAVAAPADAPPGAGKYVVLKGDKLIEGSVKVNGDVVVVRQGALDRPYSKDQIQYVADSKDEVYRFMLARVPADDAAARLQVARWCMLSGMREQALAEARAVHTLDAKSGAGDLVRSLERSLEQFPPEGAPTMTAPEKPTFPAELRVTPPVVEPEPDVAPEAAAVFAARVQPFLANQCVECHANPDRTGFKLARVTAAEASQQATRANLRAVAGQLRKDDPASSPLLVKALVAHGGQKRPSVESRRAAAYQALEAWVALAVGTPIVPPMPAPVVPPAPAVAPVLPPVVVVDPVAAPPLPLVPMVPAPPAIPPADPLLPAVAPPPKPVVPPIPPATAAAPVPLPLVQPAGGTKFGTTLPPVLPASGPTGGDEFDPAGFNQGK